MVQRKRGRCEEEFNAAYTAPIWDLPPFILTQIDDVKEMLFQIIGLFDAAVTFALSVLLKKIYTYVYDHIITYHVT